jgi:signal transduction histidine kinase
MQAYVGFDEEDQARLRALMPTVEPELPGITDRFYDRVLANETARNVFEDDAQVLRLKRTMQQWCRELLNGPWGPEYHIRRVRIGERHVQIGLPSRFMFTAMNGIRGDLCAIAQKAGDPDQLVCAAINKVTDIDLAVMCGTFMDTRLQDALRTLQDLIVHNMPVTVLCLDGDMRVTSSTRLESGSALGLKVWDVLPPSLLAQFDLNAVFKRVRESGRELTLPHIVVGRRHYRLTLVPIEHELATVLLHIEELTDVVDAQARAAQAESLAQLGSLAANVAHEIRNPLAAISATLQVIGRSFDATDRRASILKKVNDQVFRLDRLVTDLLGYARPPDAEPEVLDLTAVAVEAVALSGVEVEVVIDAPLPALGDRGYLVQVLVNLVQNARDAASAVTLTVSGTTVEIQDNGPGVPADIRPRLFEPFVTSKAKGTGLGLAICRKLCRAMDGDIVLLPERPTRFCVKLLPASEADSAARNG